MGIPCGTLTPSHLPWLGAYLVCTTCTLQGGRCHDSICEMWPLRQEMATWYLNPDLLVSQGQVRLPLRGGSPGF